MEYHIAFYRIVSSLDGIGSCKVLYLYCTAHMTLMGTIVCHAITRTCFPYTLPSRVSPVVLLVPSPIENSCLLQKHIRSEDLPWPLRKKTTMLCITIVAPPHFVLLLCSSNHLLSAIHANAPRPFCGIFFTNCAHSYISLLSLRFQMETAMLSFGKCNVLSYMQFVASLRNDFRDKTKMIIIPTVHIYISECQ